MMRSDQQPECRPPVVGCVLVERARMDVGGQPLADGFSGPRSARGLASSGQSGTRKALKISVWASIHKASKPIRRAGLGMPAYADPPRQVYA